MTSQHGRYRWLWLHVPTGGYSVGPAVLFPDGSVLIRGSLFQQKGRIDGKQQGGHAQRHSGSSQLSVKPSRGHSRVFTYGVMGWYERVSVVGTRGFIGLAHHHKHTILRSLLLVVLYYEYPSLLPIAVLLTLLSGFRSAESFSRSVIGGAPDGEFFDDDSTE